MARKPQRIVEAATIDGIGPVTARDLLAMPENRWGMLRDRITDRRHGKDGLIARCMACAGSVYVRTAWASGVSHPLFAHYSGSDPYCPWYHGRNLAPADARASQYQGRQELNAHRLMCEQIAYIVALDERHIRHTVAKYLARPYMPTVASQMSTSSGRGSGRSSSSFKCQARSRPRFRSGASTMSTKASHFSGYYSASIQRSKCNRASET